MKERCFDDIEIGEEYRTPGITVTEYQVMQYAAVSTDFWEPHTNEEFAKGTKFGRRIAHGLLGLALTDGLKNRSDFNARAIGALHWSWDFVHPIFIGDTVHVRFQVSDKRPSRSKPDCGVITLDMELINQRDEVTQRGQGHFLIERKAETP